MFAFAFLSVVHVFVSIEKLHVRALLNEKCFDDLLLCIFIFISLSQGQIYLRNFRRPIN